MENNNTIFNHGSHEKRVNQLLWAITFIGLLVSIFVYIYGYTNESIIYRLVDWATTLAYALLLNRLCTIIRVYSKSKLFSALPFILFIPTLSYSLAFFIREQFQLLEIFYQTIAVISFTIDIVTVLVLLQELKNKKFIIGLKVLLNDKTENANIVSDISDDRIKTHTESKEFPQEEKTLLETVIASILIRANNSSRMISFILATMILIVIVGGSASFGTVAINEAKKVRELEIERIKLLKIVSKLEKSDTAKTEVLKRNKEIKQLIYTEYGEENSYKSILENIERQSFTSWPDIAMRITIAALTLFLIQIFFHIYKYNQQQASQLYTPAETLELFKDTGANQDELRSSLLSKLDNGPHFEKGPTSPTEQFMNMIEKAKDSK